jgi:hypothetical protein
MIRDRDQKVWIRWLHDECMLPLEHVADVLELDPSDIAAFLAHVPRRGHVTPHVWRKGPPRRAGFARRPGLQIRGQSSRKIRRLRALNYQPFQIAAFLGIHVDDVREFIRRITPIRKTALNRPRERSVQLRLRPRLPRCTPIAPQPVAEEWSYRARPVDVAELRAAAPIAAAAVDDQVANEARAATLRPPVPTAWVGPETPRLRDPSLAGEQVDKAREMLQAGDSYPVVAKRFGVSVNTLRKYVGDIGRRRPAPTYPTTAVAYSHGVVRWDLPLARGHSVKVLVECQCGCERYIEAHDVTRPDRNFTAACAECTAPFVPPQMLTVETALEAARLRRDGCSWLELGRRLGVNRHTVRRAVERLAATPLPSFEADRLENIQGALESS